MKALIILSLTLVSFNVFAADVSENKKSECAYTDQSNRSAKPQVDDKKVAEIKKEAKSIAK
jgi:hypothetical protein